MFTYHEPMFSLAWVLAEVSPRCTLLYHTLYALYCAVPSRYSVIVRFNLFACWNLFYITWLHTVIVLCFKLHMKKDRYVKYAVLADKLKLPFNTVFYLYVKKCACVCMREICRKLTYVSLNLLINTMSYRHWWDDDNFYDLS